MTSVFWCQSSYVDKHFSDKPRSQKIVLLMGEGDKVSLSLEVNISKWVYFIYLKYMQLEISKLKMHQFEPLVLGFKHMKM